MLYIIGIGLNDEKDITVKGLEKVKKSEIVYLENYTSVLQCTKEKLEEFYGKKIILANRTIVENDDNEIIKNAIKKDVSFLVIGDALSATTHIDLMQRALKEGIKVEVIHNASIISAVAITGLQPYKFGKITSIPFDNENVEEPYNVLKQNLKNNLHTLFLLDLRPNEKEFLTIADAVRYLLKIDMKTGEKAFTEKTKCVGCARLGGDSKIKYETASKLLKEDFGKPPCCLIVPAKLHFMEEEVLGNWK